MAASGFTPISLYHTTTTTSVPLAANLVNGELALNITDGKLFYKDNLGAVKTMVTVTAGETVGTTDTQTLSNKTLTGTQETVFTITDGAAFEVNPANGGIQLITLGANRTPKATSFAAGQSVTLMVDDGSAYTLTWTDTTWGTSGVTWVGGSAPILATTGYTVLEFWKVSTKVYGSYVGAVA